MKMTKNRISVLNLLQLLDELDRLLVGFRFPFALRHVGCVHAVEDDGRIVVVNWHVVQPHQSLTDGIHLASHVSPARTFHKPARLVVRDHRSPQRRDVHTVTVSVDLLDVAAPSCYTALCSFATVITAAVREGLAPSSGRGPCPRSAILWLKLRLVLALKSIT